MPIQQSPTKSNKVAILKHPSTPHPFLNVIVFQAVMPVFNVAGYSRMCSLKSTPKRLDKK